MPDPSRRTAPCEAGQEERQWLMPSPKSFTPPSVTPSKISKRFTVAQANRTLPLVKRIVADIVLCHDQATQLQSRLEAAPHGKDHERVEFNLQQKLQRLQSLVEELRNVGVELKDFQMGLVDFIGRHEGRDVCLCWKHGEESIGYWHETSAGYTGRQPISVLKEDE